ncbi:hypothetical protein HC762_00515 [bacterium]|nr:hypothetical protein [bacterium]
MGAKYYESSFSSRSSGEKIYNEPRRGMSNPSFSSPTNRILTDLTLAERKEAPPRPNFSKKREVEIHHQYTSNKEPRRPKYTADDRLR